MDRKWEVSCLVSSDEALGRVVAALKTAGAEAIGFDAHQPGGAGLLPPPGKMSGSRSNIVRQFIRSIPHGEEFRTSQLMNFLKNHKMRTNGVSLMPYVGEGLIERIETGVYKKRG